MLTPSRTGLAVIGMGKRACGMCRLIGAIDPQLRPVAVADARPADLVRARMRGEQVPDAENVRIVASADELLDHADEYAGLVIATPCYLHAPLAVKAAGTKLPLFLEKPVAITAEQINHLRSAYAGREASVVVSFPLRLTVHVQTAMRLIRAGRLGTINQVQAVNNVPYGGVYFGQWYRNYGLTGGLWLQKATHDFDYITQLLDSRPISITAMHSRVAYGGMQPPDLVCSRCDQTEVCPESPKNLTARGDDGGTLNFEIPTEQSDHACCFSSSIRHQDAGSAIVMYECGAHAAYSQNFVTRRTAGLRGATVIGYDATLQFSWQSDILRVVDHHREHIEQIPLQATGGHGGGDQELAANFVDVIRGRAASRTPLDAGLLSAAMCLAARQAAATGITQSIPSFDPNAPIDPISPRVRGSAPIEPSSM
jgi:predicted dehydrogenase